MRGAPFAPGDLALLIDPQGNQHLVRLSERDVLHHHRGAVRHLDVIGQVEGAAVRSNQGKQFVVVRPRLLDYVLAMPRRSGVVYPKDAAQIVSWADIGPGMRVLEAGLGSGALTLVLLRAVGEAGEVVTYEVRNDFIGPALANVRAFTGAPAGNLLVREHDIYEGIVDHDLDRVVLDLPEPWRVLPHLPGALRPGGWLSAYVPSIIQASQVVEALAAERRYVQIETHEVQLRGWHVQGVAVRPSQQPIGHTGFITVARLVSEGAGLPPRPV